MQRRMIVKKREGQEKQNEEGNFKGDLNTKSFFFLMSYMIFNIVIYSPCTYAVFPFNVHKHFLCRVMGAGVKIPGNLHRQFARSRPGDISG